MIKNILPIILFLLTFVGVARAQQPTTTKKPEVVQLSGMILADEGNRLVPVPYVTVYLPEKRRGTYANNRGFFVLTVEPGDKVRFNSLGYESVTITIPDTLTQDRYSVVQMMTTDTIHLPELVIFPWPSKEHFKIEFLKMDVTPELQRLATQNLANDYLAEARRNDVIIPYSGKESANFYLRQQAREYSYIGQVPPMNIFSPLAWGQFFKAWKDGKFKKKSKG